MKASVKVDQLDAGKEIRLTLESTDPHEGFGIGSGEGGAGNAHGYLSAEESYHLALELLRCAARVGLTVQD